MVPAAFAQPARRVCPISGSPTLPCPLLPCPSDPRPTASAAGLAAIDTWFESGNLAVRGVVGPLEALVADVMQDRRRRAWRVEDERRMRDAGVTEAVVHRVFHDDELRPAG